MKNQFQIKRRDGKIIMVDTAENEYILTVAQAEKLGRGLVYNAKWLKRAHQLRKRIRKLARAR